MLVSSFDTKYSQTATKYEYLDNNFTNLLSKDRRFSRIFTSVIENQKLDLSSDIVLRSDMTGQVINTILTHDFKSEHFLYYMGDVFKPDLVNKSIKQYRQHGLEIINRPKMESFIEVMKVLDKLLKKILKNNLKIEGLGRLQGIPKLLKYIRISCRGGNLRKEKLKLLQMKLPH